MRPPLPKQTVATVTWIALETEASVVVDPGLWTSGGFDYAGLQYGSQCICTNSGPQGTSDESQCTYGCAGDSSVKMCGGLGYINIFHTDAHKSTIDDFGCGSTAQDTYYQRWFEDMGHCNISTSLTAAPPVPTTTTLPPVQENEACIDHAHCEGDLVCDGTNPNSKKCRKHSTIINNPDFCSRGDILCKE